MPGLVGRASLVAAAAEAIGDGRSGGVLIVGPAGVGKTALADAVTDAIRESGLPRDQPNTPIDVWRLFASRVSGQIPLGVLTTNLPAEFIDSPLSPTLALKQMLADRDGQLVAIVDDADLVDDPSAEALAAASASGAILPVMTQRTGTELPESLQRLVRTGLVTRIECPPLDRVSTIELAADVAGSPLSPTAEQLVVDVTLGNPLFVRELVLAAIETGRASLVDGRTELDRVPTGSSRLGDLVARRLAEISDDGRNLLLRIAAAEPLGPGELEAIADATVVDELQARAMLQFDLDDRRVRIRVAHPMIAEALRATATPLALREHRSVVARAITSFGARRRDDRLRLASWSVEGGEPVATEYLTEASRMVFAARDLERSAALANLAFEQSPSFETGRTLEAPLFELGDAERLDALFERWVPMASDDDERATAVRCVAAGRFWRGGDERGIAELIDHANGLERVDLRSDLLAQAASLRTTQGRITEALEIAEPYADDPPSAVFARVALALGHGRRAAGRPHSALTLLERTSAAYRAAGPEAYVMSSLVLDGARLAALADTGAFDRVRAAASDTLTLATDAGQPTAVGLAHLSLSWNDIHQGLYEHALASAHEAERWLAAACHPGMVRWALGWQALIESLRGDAAATRAVLTRLDDLDPHPAALFDAVTERARARLAHLDGFPVAAHDILVAAAEDAARLGNVASELGCWQDLARLGHVAVALRGIDQLPPDIEGEVFTAQSAHVRALASGRVDELGRSSDRFADIGQWHLAAEVAHAAAHAAAQRSDVTAANRWLRRAAEIRSRTEHGGPDDHPLLRELTARELDVVRLATTGLSSREIGERLFISTRTVDGHLRRTYAKLNVSGRAELAALLSM